VDLEQYIINDPEKLKDTSAVPSAYLSPQGDRTMVFLSGTKRMDGTPLQNDTQVMLDTERCSLFQDCFKQLLETRASFMVVVQVDDNVRRVIQVRPWS